MTKKLLVFAHRGEARAFLKHFPFQSISEGLYKDENHLLLICGEGHFNAHGALSYVLGKYENEVDSIINLGIAGGLTPKVEKGQIYPVRTLYSELVDKMEFKSFVTSNNEGIDLITSHQRILSNDKKKYLENFAPAVDREAWALALATSRLSLPFFAYKLISDDKSDRDEGVEICLRAKELADDYSERLLEYYLNLENKTEETKELHDWNGFYFTTSQKNRRDSLLRKLSLKYPNENDLLEALSVKQILEQEHTPKKKTNILLEEMRSLLNPVSKQVEESLEELSSELVHAGATIKYPKDLERPQFHLSATVERHDDLVKLIKNLENYDYQRLVEIIEGRELDV